MYRKLEQDDFVSFFVLKGAGITYKTIGMLFGCCVSLRQRQGTVHTGMSVPSMRGRKPPILPDQYS